MRTGLPTLLALLAFIGSPSAGESRQIAGRVLDEKGDPVQDAFIAFRWRANGPDVDQDGIPIDPTTPEGHKLFWSNLGQMAPSGGSRSGIDGRFSIEVPGHYFNLMAMDVQYARGGLTRIPKEDDNSEVEIRLQRLVRVKGTVEGPELGHRPTSSLVTTNALRDPARPFHFSRIVICGSPEARFMMSLPPGRYVLEARNDPTTEAMASVEKTIDLTGETPEVDLGVLRLAKEKPTVNDRIKQLRTSGAMRDHTKHYGEKLPDWHIVDAHGVSKNVRLSDYRGKWVLLDFWALDCIPCMKHDLPKLARFYNDHQAQRDQFEILAICVDVNGERKSLAEVDRALEPIVQHVWGGKPLPFPMLLDTGMTTLERFGVPGYQTILIDPDGKLVEGDESTLAEKLEQTKR